VFPSTKSRTGDTIESAGKNAYRATFVDKLLWANIMPDKTATTLNKVAVRAFNLIPAQMRNTLMRDKGKEFAAHKCLSQTLGIDSSSAHSYHSWEWGLNEHTYGVIRQYRSKKIAFDGLTPNSLTKSLSKSITGSTRV
jgi:IS30 family transposase